MSPTQEVTQVSTTTGAEPLLITVKAAADRLSITPWSLYKMLDQGIIASCYQGRRRYVRTDSLHKYVASLPATPPVAS